MDFSDLEEKIDWTRRPFYNPESCIIQFRPGTIGLKTVARRALKNPKFVKIGIIRDRKLLAIQSCTNDEPLAYNVTINRLVSCAPLLKLVSAMFNDGHPMEGDYRAYLEKNTLYVDLTDKKKNKMQVPEILGNRLDAVLSMGADNEDND